MMMRRVVWDVKQQGCIQASEITYPADQFNSFSNGDDEY
jgi:hypothetical protein